MGTQSEFIKDTKALRLSLMGFLQFIARKMDVLLWLTSRLTKLQLFPELIMKKTHSIKALETLRQMNTVPENWGLVEIIWKKELRKVRTKVRCPECFGTGRATYEGNGDGSLANESDLLKSVGYQHLKAEQLKKDRNLKTRNCKCCPVVQKTVSWGANYIKGTGEIYEMVERKVKVGYPQFAADTKFDSRFQYSDGRSFHHCALCSKGINQSGRVPVTGKGADGIIHGMWVGEDCAKKFLGVVLNFKKTDHFIADNLAGE